MTKNSILIALLAAAISLFSNAVFANDHDAESKEQEEQSAEHKGDDSQLHPADKKEAHH